MRPIQALLSVSREYPETKTSAGLFLRWEEIRRIGERHTGMSLTPGTLSYLMDTLRTYFAGRQDLEETFPGHAEIARILWDCTSPYLARSVGRPDGFPGPDPLGPRRPPIASVRELADMQRVISELDLTCKAQQAQISALSREMMRIAQASPPVGSTPDAPRAEAWWRLVARRAAAGVTTRREEEPRPRA
ncbi:MAG: hypothetical protein HY722_09245 [Planctomycetes bacterium]|nr:hypothetical protein [Planctomycetota bacterium]